MTADNQSGWDQFLILCQQCKTTAEIEELLNLLLTIEEKNQIASRVLLIKELMAAQKTQRQIANELELSIAKITRGSNALKTISKKLKDFLNKKLFLHP